MSSVAVRAPQPVRLGPVKAFTLADVITKGESLPNRYALHAREGWGKTSFGAQAVKPFFLQTRGETGLDTLIDSGQLPEIPHFPEIQAWEELLSAVSLLADGDHPYRTLVIDTVNGAERLLYEYVCRTQFAGDWTDRGFMGYMRGYEVSLADWRMFLNALDELRTKRKMVIFFLIHTKVKTFKNPEGPDYDRWTPDMHEKCWSLTHKWLDCVLFGNFDVGVKGTTDATKKGKASEAIFRTLHTQQRPAFDAKNRMGLPEEIDMGSSAADGWNSFTSALKSSRRTPEVA